MLLEVCANSFQSALNAQKGGANRIELCSELSVGGITPSFGVLKKVLESLSIQTFVLIRPRSGDFVFSDSEFEIMKHNIELCKNLGCSGIVSGVLNEDNTIDLERTQQLVELSRPLQFTFHRAFDYVPNLMDSLGQLIDIGVNRVLASGQELTAEKGIDKLQALKTMAQNKIIILPGGGINTENAKLFKDFEFQEIHASASKKQLKRNRSISFGGIEQTVSSVSTIKSILKAVS